MYHDQLNGYSTQTFCFAVKLGLKFVNKMSDTKSRDLRVSLHDSDDQKEQSEDCDIKPASPFETGTRNKGEPKASVTVQDVVPIVEPKEQLIQGLRLDKKKTKRATPALKVLTSRNKNFVPCQSQLSTPATDFTPFHSPADPLKLNSDGPNWQLFNKKVADSLDKLAQLTIHDDKSSTPGKDCSTKLELNADDSKI